MRRLEARLDETSAYQACASLQPPLGPLARAPCVVRRTAGNGLDPLSRRPLLDQIRWMLDRSADGATLKSAYEYVAAHAGELPPPAAELAAGALLHGEALARGDAGLLIDALDHAQRSVELAPRSPAASFNRALILADLGLCRQARQDFRAVLTAESDPGWRAEALARLEQLPCQPGAARAPGPDAWFRMAVEEKLGAWGGGIADSVVAATERTEIGLLGAKLAAAGDPFVTRLAAELDRSAPDREYAAAVANLVAGRAAFAAGRYQAATPLLAVAAAQLEGRRSVLVPWCRIWRAGLAIRSGDWQAVDALVASDAAMFADAGPRIEGQRLWALGLARLRQGKLALALAHFTKAEAVLDRAGYREATASIRTLRAETLARLGLAVESWRPRVAAIRELQSPQPLFTLHNALVEGAELADRTRAPALADALIAEARLLAEEQSDRTNRVEATLFAAEIWQHRGERARAESTFRDAQGEASRIEEITVARIFGAAAALGLWKSAERDSPRVEPLLSVLRFYTGHGPAWQEIDAERALARWHVGVGDVLAAERDLARAAAVAARQGDAVQDDQRTSAQARELLADRVRLAFAARAPRRALDLFDTAGEAAAAGARTAIDPRLTAGRPEVVLALLPLENQVAWWRLADGRLESGLAPFGSWRIAEGEGRRQTPEQLARTYQALLGTPLAGIAPERPLALVVGPALRGVPFAALRNPASGAHLIEERAIRFHESVHEAIEMLDQPQATSTRRDWRAVAVGAPQLEPALSSLFEPLPRAGQEAQDVAGLYGPGSRALVGTAATATAVRTALAGADVLHLAVHGVAGGGSASRSLALASEPGVEGGGLTAPGDLLGPHAEPRLVVLSVCSSLGGGEGPGSAVGLAQAFVSRHVPATVGTLWPLEDGLLAKLTLAFHRGLIAGLSASEALRTAQREAIAKGGDEGCCGWAALQLIGDLPPTAIASVKEKEH